MKHLLSAMALFISFSANSAVINLGTLTPLHLQPFSVNFTGDVSDTYTFTVAAPFAFTSSVVAGGTGVDDITTSLTSLSFASLGDDSTVLGGLAYQSTLVESFLAAGNYSFNVLVATTGTTAGQYFGSFTVASPTVAAIPEPETYAMFLAGLGLLGFAARKRNV
jgi:hypothetical protein